MPRELQRHLMSKLKQHTLPARILLNRFCFPDEDIRRKPEYLDNAWMPFWYYLGELERPKTLLDVGSALGLETACCILGAKDVVHVEVYDKQSRFTKVNVRLAGGVYDDVKEWDLAIVNGDFCARLDSIWDKIRLAGLICVTNNWEVLEGFAKVRNRVPVFCNLRYSVGLLRK